MGSKIVNWIRFFGVNPDNWKVEQAGDTAWIAQRPFKDLKGLEKNMPNPPKMDEVREWYEPFIRDIKEVYDSYDLVFVGGVEGPVTDAYSFMDMELFALGIYDAPELIYGLHGKIFRIHRTGLCGKRLRTAPLYGRGYLRKLRSERISAEAPVLYSVLDS
jgi:hypothetical protein